MKIFECEECGTRWKSNEYKKTHNWESYLDECPLCKNTTHWDIGIERLENMKSTIKKIQK